MVFSSMSITCVDASFVCIDTKFSAGNTKTMQSHVLSWLQCNLFSALRSHYAMAHVELAAAACWPPTQLSPCPPVILSFTCWFCLHSCIMPSFASLHIGSYGVNLSDMFYIHYWHCMWFSHLGLALYSKWEVCSSPWFLVDVCLETSPRFCKQILWDAMVWYGAVN